MNIQDQLNEIESRDRDEIGFLIDISNWNNHRPLLLLAMELSDGLVVEFGSGEGSTKYLRKLCAQKKRQFVSYDSSFEWADKYHSIYVEDIRIQTSVLEPCGLFFCDHAPGEDRKLAIKDMAAKADVIVIHDTELGGAGNYGFEPLWPLFKYVLHYNRTGGGAGATAVSNKIDLHQFAGHSLGGFKFEL